mgnify:CR=1 FL=1
MATSVRRRLQQDLKLADEQVRQIAPVVDRFAREMGLVHSSAVDRSLEVIRQMHQQVEEFLTPEQKEKFRKVQQEREETFRRAARLPK